MRLFAMMFVLLLGLKIVALMSESIKYNLVMIREKNDYCENCAFLV